MLPYGDKLNKTFAEKSKPICTQCFVSKLQTQDKKGKKKEQEMCMVAYFICQQLRI